MQTKYVEQLLFLYGLIRFVNVPTEKQLVIRKVCLNMYDASLCTNSSAITTLEEDNIQAISAKWSLQLNIASVLPSLLSTLVLGPLSDQVGRMAILWLALCGELLNTIGYFLNSWYISSPVSYLFIHVVLNGICGGFPAIGMAAVSYTHLTLPTKA